MKPKHFALSLIAAGLGLFGVVLGANVVIDPQAVLGTNLLGHVELPNQRYSAFEDFLAQPGRYDGLVFGSSRGPGIDPKRLTREMDGIVFADFSVSSGQISDHLPVLEYAVRDKDPKRKKIRAVFLMLDADYFGVRQIGRNAMYTLLHPMLTGEARSRFIWRHLTAIQPRAWSLGVRQWWRRRGGMRVELIGRAHAQSTASQVAQRADAAPKHNPEKKRITFGSEFERQIALLRRFVELCRANDIKLIVALSPLNRLNASQYEAADLDMVVQRIAAVVPVWDFDSPAWLAGTEFWRDPSHFNPVVGEMMADRIFGRPAARLDFGRLRGGESSGSGA
ncbi:MAG: hypothetical protein ACRECO_18800 [Xanthobacteraceae bacterium]